MRTFIAAIFFTITFSYALAQTSSLSLPKLAACKTNAHPLLPEKWRATFLMAPFTRSQLVVSDIEADDSLSAMRARLYGVKRGALDLFVQGNNTFLLESKAGTLEQCRNLGDTGWRALPRDWLTPQSECAASAPIGSIQAEWWKISLKSEPATSWIWYGSDNHLPLRLLFQFPDPRLAVFGQFALSHQLGFEELRQSGLAEVAEFCKRAGQQQNTGSIGADKLISNMSRASSRAGKELARLAPHLRTQCPEVSFPGWPQRLALTGIMTPFDSSENPMPAEVLYDWQIPAQRTRVFFPPGSELSAMDALLLGPRGYNVMHGMSGAQCGGAQLPGTLRPDWPSRGGCTCEATIDGGTPLTPKGPTRILACTLAHPRIAWSWSTLEGEPSLFMVTSMPGDQGFGLFAMLDYHEWRPDYPSAKSDFTLPQQCLALTADTPPAPEHCATCHLGPAAIGQ